MSVTTPTVLFLCIHNAGRSQMAAALLEQIAGDAITVLSAGSEPADSVNPSVAALLLEVGIDVSSRVPKLLTNDMALEADVVVTMGCGDTCPYYPGKRYLDWELDDPKGKSIDEVRPIREDIERRVRALAAELLGS
jgi:protein-tyrosine-phosphatase